MQEPYVGSRSRIALRILALGIAVTLLLSSPPKADIRARLRIGGDSYEKVWGFSSLGLYH